MTTPSGPSRATSREEGRAASRAAADALAEARASAAGLRRSTDADRERLGPLPAWGDGRFQQQLRDGWGGDAARRLQAEVDARRTDWDALRRDDDPRFSTLLRQWAEEAGAAVRRGLDDEPDAAAGTAGHDADLPPVRPRPRTRDDGAGAGSR